mgnify:CR=1 FL=1|tara:strand:+ start:12320 stop:12541 length:222 start_codon:yes stop_codon:yes gene_type:complete
MISEEFKRYLKKQYLNIEKEYGHDYANKQLERFYDDGSGGTDATLEELFRIVWGDAFVDTQIALREANRKLKP